MFMAGGFLILTFPDSKMPKIRTFVDDSIPTRAVRDRADLLEVLAHATAHQTKLDIRGHGSRLTLGRPVAADQIITLDGLNGITLYEPDELVLVAKAATPMSAILKTLDEAQQMLAFDPPLRALSHSGAVGTIGGVMATNASGPRRIVAGAARDYLLGFHAVSGRGEAFKSGGRVMKNVTGYDLSKLMAGSFGTLAVMDEITLKTMPKPETARTLLIETSDEIEAGAVLKKAFDSPHEPTTGAILPARAAVFSSLKKVKEFAQTKAIAVIRLEGFDDSVSDRLAALTDRLLKYQKSMILKGNDANRLHAELRDVRLLPENEHRVIWKLSCPPAEGGALLKELLKRPNCCGYADWAGGLIWLSHPSGVDGGAEILRQKIRSIGGHATLISAPEAMRRAVPVFEPQPEALMDLSRRIKASFDPLGILNHGRIYEGI